jgi:hypothetical protein
MLSSNASAMAPSTGATSYTSGAGQMPGGTMTDGSVATGNMTTPANPDGTMGAGSMSQADTPAAQPDPQKPSQ